VRRCHGTNVGDSCDSTPLLNLSSCEMCACIKRTDRKGEGRWVKAKAISALLQRFYVLYLHNFANSVLLYFIIRLLTF